METTAEYSGLYTQKDGEVSLPRLLKKEKQLAGLRLIYSLPIGLCKDNFDKELARLEQAVNGEISIKRSLLARNTDINRTLMSLLPVYIGTKRELRIYKESEVFSCLVFILTIYSALHNAFEECVFLFRVICPGV